ncbi:hypothetical protein N657DRAFT_364355 [Parathielavia appendiculata]|uniref:Uncharacterized protein n=1 Tax=Parathielavia appendiculata TaxID=2587402 RepID=A0AAN6Z4V3_9PEZI|nr:hypothetical protein N657DRAFT_364355 [Parathielavia appendiculata]
MTLGRLGFLVACRSRLVYLHRPPCPRFAETKQALSVRIRTESQTPATYKVCSQHHRPNQLTSPSTAINGTIDTNCCTRTAQCLPSLGGSAFCVMLLMI